MFCALGCLYLFLLLLQIFYVLGGNRKPYAGSVESWSDFPSSLCYGSNLGHKIADFVGFLLLFPHLYF